jgi:hypothetical protein
MKALAQVVFVLSPKAIAALAKKGEGLEPRLHTVLALVDGVSPVAQYVPFLKMLEPVEEKFAELEALGYLLRVGAVSPLAVRVFQDSVAAGASVTSLPNIDSRTPDSGFVPFD